jgi:hypothetical protein
MDEFRREWIAITAARMKEHGMDSEAAIFEAESLLVGRMLEYVEKILRDDLGEVVWDDEFFGPLFTIAAKVTGETVDQFVSRVKGSRSMKWSGPESMN